MSVLNYHIRCVHNRHDNAQVACHHWLAGSLWGNPIVLSPNNIHIYGVWLRDWSRVHIQFTKKWIVIAKP